MLSNLLPLDFLLSITVFSLSLDFILNIRVLKIIFLSVKLCSHFRQTQVYVFTVPLESE